MIITIKHWQSEVWFSDEDENPYDLLDEIVLNEDIYNDLYSDNEVSSMSNKVRIFFNEMFYRCSFQLYVLRQCT